MELNLKKKGEGGEWDEWFGDGEAEKQVFKGVGLI